MSLYVEKFKRFNDMRVFSFEKLNVWQKAKKLSVSIYKTTTSFPSEEKFGLISQMRRCSISISSDEIYNDIRMQLTEIAAMLDGLYKSQINDIK